MVHSFTIYDILTRNAAFRGERLAVEAEGIYLDYSKNRLTDETLRLLLKLADAIEARADEIGRLESANAGKPVGAAIDEVPVVVDNLRFFAGAGRVMEGKAVNEYVAGHTSLIRREPVGVVASIAPWNYPYLTSVNSIVPGLMAGNAVLLKHSPQTPLCAERYAEAFAEAGLPEGVFQYLHLSQEDTLRVVAAPEVDFVAFTGSVAGGRAMERAAQGRFIGLALELGGKDPAVVLEDADLDRAARGVVFGAFFNAGQTCLSTERVFVVEAVHDAFVEEVVKAAAEWKLGDPFDAETKVGPMNNEPTARKMDAHVADALAKGATLVLGGSRESGRPTDLYYQPTVLADVSLDTLVNREETFGPVAPLFRFRDEAEAVAHNRASLRQWLPAEPLWLRQVHGTTVGEADSVGEVSLLDGAPRPADVFAETDLHLLAIERQAFLDLVSDRPELLQGVLAQVAGAARAIQASAREPAVSTAGFLRSAHDHLARLEPREGR